MHAIVNDEPVDRSWENISCQTLELVGIFFTCLSQLMHFSFPAPKFRPHSPCKTDHFGSGYHMNRWSLLPLQYYLYRCGFENICINNPMLKDDIFVFAIYTKRSNNTMNSVVKTHHAHWSFNGELIFDIIWKSMVLTRSKDKYLLEPLIRYQSLSVGKRQAKESVQTRI